MYYTYILFSKIKPSTYIGSTSNLEKRLKEHNSGRVKSTKVYRPFILIYKEEFNSLGEAKNKENFFKTTTGRRKIKDIIEYLSFK